jgi:hypothetical protein
MRTTLLAFVLSVMLSALACAGGCDRSGRATSLPKEKGPVFVFFDGITPISPQQWATGVSSDFSKKRGNGDSLARLSIKEVVRMWRDEKDASAIIMTDLPVIEELASSEHLDLTWQGSRKQCDVLLREEIKVPNKDGFVDVSLFVLYLLAIKQSVETGLLDSEPLIGRLADSLLVLGYNVYRSDVNNAIESEESRMILLGGCWRTACTIRARIAHVQGNAEEAKMWQTRRDEVDVMLSHFNASWSRRIGCR